jgi:hypothetical protein
MDRLPNFLIIGAQKCGTTWLAAMLRQHPDVYMPDQEIHFFDKAGNYEKGIEWYAGHFAGAENIRRVGEKTPDYFWADGRGGEGHLPDVNRHIHRHLPDAKLIVTLKNPVDRAVSAVKHLIRTRRISPLHRMDDLLAGKKAALLERFGVFEVGRFFTLLTAYLDLFRRDQILVLFFEEDIVQRPHEGLKKVCSFLEIDDSFRFSGTARQINRFDGCKLHLVVRYYFPVLSPLTSVLGRLVPESDFLPGESVLRHLYGFYREENRKLFDLLGRESPAAWLAT